MTPRNPNPYTHREIAAAESPEGAVPPAGGAAPFSHPVEYFEELSRVECPVCRRYLPYRLAVGYQPIFQTHQHADRRVGRFAVYRHPVSRAVKVREVPDGMSWESFHAVLLRELRAAARRGDR